MLQAGEVDMWYLFKPYAINIPPSIHNIPGLKGLQNWKLLIKVYK